MREAVRYPTILAIAILTALGIQGCGGAGRSSFLKERSSDYNLSETARRFAEALAPKNYRRIAAFDHEAVAAKLRMYLRPTRTLELENPKISSKLLECNPTMALELPLRVGIYNELNGTTHLVYTNPEYWSLKHNIKDKTCLALVQLLARDLDSAADAVRKQRP